MSAGETDRSSWNSSYDSSDVDAVDAVVESSGARCETFASERVFVGKEASDRRSAADVTLAGSMAYIHLPLCECVGAPTVSLETHK